jgi:hypothetical protein
VEQVVEGRDGTAVSFRERLVPVWWVWAALLFVTGTLGVAYLAAVGPAWGLGAFVVSTGAAVWGLVSTTPVVQVDDLVVRAGRARLPLPYAGRAESLAPDAATALRGPDADARAFLLLRPAIPGAVRIDVDDPRDPHPYWLVSSRHADRLAAAVNAATGRG